MRFERSGPLALHELDCSLTRIDRAAQAIACDRHLALSLANAAVRPACGWVVRTNLSTDTVPSR